MKKCLVRIIFFILATNPVFAFEPYADNSGKTTQNFSITTTDGRGQEYNAEVVDPKGQSVEINVQNYNQQSNSTTSVNYANPQPSQMGQPAQ